MQQPLKSGYSIEIAILYVVWFGPEMSARTSALAPGGVIERWCISGVGPYRRT